MRVGGEWGATVPAGCESLKQTLGKAGMGGDGRRAEGLEAVRPSWRGH